MECTCADQTAFNPEDVLGDDYSPGSQYKPCSRIDNIKHCQCRDDTGWTYPGGPCKDGSFDIAWCRCADGTLSTPHRTRAQHNCGMDNLPTECGCRDESRFDPADTWDDQLM